MKKLILGLIVLLAGGCGTISWDGKIAKTVPVSSIEVPLNALGSTYGVKAGSLLVSADKAAVKAWGENTSKESVNFPVVSVATNHFDSKNQEVFPPFRTVRTPVYGVVTNEYFPTQSIPTPVIIDSNTIQQIISAWVMSQGKLGTVTLNPQTPTVPSVNPPVSDDPEKPSVDNEIGGGEQSESPKRPKFGNF